jgi:YD repeat-containing protein
MESKTRHGVLISLVVISLIAISFNTSYAETTTYTYDELNRLIQVIYEDGRGVIYTYDASGNRITLASYPDTVPPTGTIIINSGAATTYNPAVTLTLTCSDNVGCSQMQFSNDNITYSTPETYATSKAWTLTSGDGTKTVYAKFKDLVGNWSTVYSDTINLITDSYTKSLLHMNGTDGSTTFTDSATGGTHTWTASGNAQIDTAQSKFGGASGLFDGTGDYLSSADSPDWYFDGDFTFDCWVRFNVLSHVQFYRQYQDANNEIDLYYNNTDHRIYFYIWAPGAYSLRFYVLWTPSTSTWYHIALVRNGNTWDIYVNGTAGSKTLQYGSYTATYPNLNGNMQVQLSNTGFLNGWLDEVRFSKGIARWTANFTPPINEY